VGIEIPQNKFLILDGAMGTVLQQRGLSPQGRPELLNLTEPELLNSVYKEYIAAGSQVIYANTFGANGLKLAKTGHSVEEVVGAAIAVAKKAAAGTGTLVALDVGPLGELLEPMGTLSFERAYDLFREMAEAGAKAGADLIVVETMTDLYEAKAALLAAKEHSDLPVLVTMTYEATGRTFLGCSPACAALTLEGLGADAIGVNCSLGPREMPPLVEELLKWTTLPIVLKPNAGLPRPDGSGYDISPEAPIFPITERAAQKQLKLVCDYLGYTGISTHSFRKFYATEIYKNSHYNIALVQQLLQHSSAAVTQRYIGIQQQEIEEAIEGHLCLDV